MLKKTDAVLFTPGLPVRRMVPRLIPIVLLLSLMTTCQEPEKPEPYPDSDLVLEKLDVSCTEAWLRLVLTQTDSGATDSIPIILTRDGEAIQPFAFTPPETLVMDAGLYPSHSYQYQVQRQSVHDNKIIDSSNTLTVTTLDTTSHDFTWTIDTLGNYGSYLNDVAMIDEDNIWAVGMIETDSGSYNAAHWEGEEWGLVRIAPPPFLFAPLTSIYALSGTDVWVAGTAPMEFDGEIWNAKPTYPTSGWINAIWGSSPEDVWFVGNGGSIVHYDGSGFVAINNLTDLDLVSITGSGSNNVWVSGNNLTTGGINQILLHFDGQNWEQVLYNTVTNIRVPNYISGFIAGVYIESPFNILLYTHLGFYRASVSTRGEAEFLWNTSNDGTAIEVLIGNDRNDLFAAGSHARIWHFNGNNFRGYPAIPDVGTINGGAINRNYAVFVGSTYSDYHSFVIKGYR
ncbi:MAG: hypothetical protein K9N34_03235 [Candidatus Marinimicrobia bacterium]|nr:hypothetical protein [Candidatus Neomarinimicrobiota bacterium]MCF7839447.1 hypothetical protein [Candidatus Neomarinimicrobiota bacterium]MCF7902906.1 hypothetical protein [Candidatus Neomarinimicrobiota bacterium]